MNKLIFISNIATFQLVLTMKEYEQSEFDKLMLGDLVSMVHINKYIYRGVTSFKLHQHSPVTYYKFIYVGKYGNIRTICLHHPYDPNIITTVRDYKIHVTDSNLLNLTIANNDTYSLLDLHISIVSIGTPPKHVSQITMDNIFVLNCRIGDCYHSHLHQGALSYDIIDTTPAAHISSLLKALLLINTPAKQITISQTEIDNLIKERETLNKQIAELTEQLNAAKNMINALQPVLAKLDTMFDE